MGKRQKIILILYVYAVVFLGFIYVPYVRHYANGAKEFIGHHFRVRILQLSPWETQTYGPVVIDANLMIAEILSITAIVITAFLLLRKEK
jgi:hypothetical protein